MPAYGRAGAVRALLGTVRAALSSDDAQVPAVADLSALLSVHYALARQHHGFLSISVHQRQRTRLSAGAAQCDAAGARFSHADGRVPRDQSSTGASGHGRRRAGIAREAPRRLAREPQRERCEAYNLLPLNLILLARH